MDQEITITLKIKERRAKHRAYLKQWLKNKRNDPEWRARKYANHKRWIAANKEKLKAHRLVDRYMRSGKMLREMCRVCGSPNSQAHHPDYSKPKEVVWLCQIHHEEIHHPIEESIRAKHAKSN